MAIRPLPWLGRWQLLFRLVRWWARVLLGFIGIRVRAEGLENIDASGPFVLAANHASVMDIPVLIRVFPMHLRFLSKRELLKAPFLGSYIRFGRHVTVERGDPRAAMRSLMEAAGEIRSWNLPLVVFPEGTRSPDGSIQPFKEGAALMAIRAGVPILPVAIRGTADALPARSTLLRGAEVSVYIGEPLSTEGMESKHRRAITEELERRIRLLHEGMREAEASRGPAY